MGAIDFYNKKLLLLKNVTIHENNINSTFHFYTVETELNSFVFSIAHFIYVSLFLSH